MISWFCFLKVLLSITFLARGWLTYRWDSPIRGLLWSEEFLAPVLQKYLGLDWGEFAANSDKGITIGLELSGILLMVSALIPWLPLRAKFAVPLILPAILIVILDAWARYVDSAFQLGMLIEYALQLGIPFLWLFARLGKSRPQKQPWVIATKILIAMTFIGHGMYAVGLHPVPWRFQSMTQDILRLSESNSLLFLRTVGYLDFVVAIGLFIRAIEKPMLIYMVFWGATTALARILSQPTQLDPWLVETLVRSVHWGVPLLVIWNQLGRVPNINRA